MNKKHVFNPRARMLLHLGDQLIRSENIAIIELVKNAYDADASKCTVCLNNPDDISKGSITIEDDGIGMTPDIVNRVWLEPGANFKELLIEGNQARFDFVITMPKRVPIGEKGVGRFGVHKLGNLIELITKSPDSDKEVVIRIDWEQFSDEIYLSDAGIEVIERQPKHFTNGATGTYINVSKLRKVWDEKMYKDLSRSLLTLSSPFEDNNTFRASAELKLSNKENEEEWLKKDVTIEEVREAALWELDCLIEGDEFKEFSYLFEPKQAMNKLQKRSFTIDGLNARDRKLIYNSGRSSEKVLDLSAYRIGPIRVRAYVYDLTPSVVRLSFDQPKALTEYMSQNGGVRVYRDNMRVYDYGEPGNDWLDLDRSRINEPVDKVGNKNILGAVMLDRRKSLDLAEKTNREGFVENPAYFAFRQAISIALDKFTQERNIDKTHIRDFYGSKAKAQPVVHDVDELKIRIQEKLEPLEIEGKDNFLKEIDSSLERIKSQYNESNKLLLRSAGAGLSLSAVIHEIEKRIKELKLIADSDDIDPSRLRAVVQNIVKLVDNYTVLVSKDKKKNLSIKQIIDEAIFTAEYRFKAHGITIEGQYSTGPNGKVRASVNAIISVLINIFDNSIHWLHHYNVTSKKIFIGTKEYDDEVSVLVADNGLGFSIDFEDAIEPYISKKVGGMGLGLYIASELMSMHSAKLVLRSYDEVSDRLPADYSNGAILELIFKKEK